MIRILLIFPLITILIAPVDAGDYDSMMITVPRGDPEAGKKAFRDMGCQTCHIVQGEKDSPAILSANPGPELGRRLHAEQSMGRLATSIVMPSHKISKEVQERMEGKLSPMGDFSEVMTVRQLIDIIAYIRDQGLKSEEKK